MPRLGRIVIGLGLALVTRQPVWADEPPLGGTWVSAAEGEAQVQFGDDANWRNASPNMPLLPGDRVQVGPTGRIELVLAGGTAIRLGPSSTARLVTVPPADAAPHTTAEVDLETGRIIVVTGDGEPSRPVVTLNVPGTRIQAYPRSQVRAKVVAPDTTEVLLREGAATVHALGVSIPLRVAEALRVGAGAVFPVAASPEDDFDRYVWQPTATVTGWAPFSNGGWVWRGRTWVWLPREPWGWVPFHYGGWRWNPSLGWYWVPPRPKVIAWCPGAVAWIQTPSYVIWIPLAPGEMYYSPGPYGPRSALGPPVTVINITHVHITKVFVNAAAPAPVVAVPVTAFKASTVVTSTATKVSLSTLSANQAISVVAPAALAPVNAAGRAVASPIPLPPPVAGGLRPREDRGKHEPRAERYEPRVEHGDPRWFAGAQSSERPAARIHAPQARVQGTPVDRHLSQPALMASKAPERQRNVVSGTPVTSPVHPGKAPPRPEQQPAPSARPVGVGR